MLKTQYIRENREEVVRSLKIRNWTEEQLTLIDKVLVTDDSRKQAQTALDELLAGINARSKQIGELYKSGKAEEANQLKAEVSEIKEKTQGLNDEMNQAKVALDQLLLQIPNIVHPTVPAGKGEEENEVYKECTSNLDKPEGVDLAHWDLAEKYDILDMAAGAKIAGSGFPVFKGKGARLQRALISYLLDQVTDKGYLEIMPPLLVNEDTARATGQLPDKEGQMYHATADNLYLIPTAEVPITNLYRDVIVKEEELPIKLTGHTPCFRREAGSYGADVKGLNRVHQFDKVEIVQISHPDKSYEILEEMVLMVSGLLENLELPYRILRLCGGDVSFTSALTFDLEVFSLAQQRWLEVSSVSNFETYQTNRLKCRFKDENGKMRLTHSLNGSAFGLARVMAAILENNQSSDGIRIPKVLIPYTRFDVIN
jgi:seryl-tRNA synthetase